MSQHQIQKYLVQLRLKQKHHHWQCVRILGIEFPENEKNMSNEIFKTYFGYHTPPFLVEDLYKVNQDKNDKMASRTNDTLLTLD